MFDLNEFKTDSTAQERGVWIDFGGGAKFQIASLSSRNFQKEFKSKTSPYTDIGRDIPEEEQEKIMIECISKHIVMDWVNVFDGDEIFKYSSDNCIKLMTEIPAVRDMVINEAKKIQNFKKAKQEETAGKSKSALNGK